MWLAEVPLVQQQRTGEIMLCPFPLPWDVIHCGVRGMLCVPRGPLALMWLTQRISKLDMNDGICLQAALLRMHYLPHSKVSSLARGT